MIRLRLALLPLPLLVALGAAADEAVPVLLLLILLGYGAVFLLRLRPGWRPAPTLPALTLLLGGVLLALMTFIAVVGSIELIATLPRWIRGHPPTLDPGGLLTVPLMLLGLAPLALSLRRNPFPYPASEPAWPAFTGAGAALLAWPAVGLTGALLTDAAAWPPELDDTLDLAILAPSLLLWLGVCAAVWLAALRRVPPASAGALLRTGLAGATAGLALVVVVFVVNAVVAIARNDVGLAEPASAVFAATIAGAWIATFRGVAPRRPGVAASTVAVAVYALGIPLTLGPVHGGLTQSSGWQDVAVVLLVPLVLIELGLILLVGAGLRRLSGPARIGQPTAVGA